MNCRHCCLTLHRACMPNSELYNPNVPYVCPRHPTKKPISPGQQNRPLPQVVRPPTPGSNSQPLQISPRLAPDFHGSPIVKPPLPQPFPHSPVLQYYSSGPSYPAKPYQNQPQWPPRIDPGINFSPNNYPETQRQTSTTGSKLLSFPILTSPIPHQLPINYQENSNYEKIIKEHTQIKQGGSILSMNIPAEILEHREIYAEMSAALAHSIEQELKPSAIQSDDESEDMYDTNDIDEWNRVSGNDMYILTQGNIENA